MAASMNDTAELLKPVREEVIPNNWWRRLWRLHEHCFHEKPIDHWRHGRLKRRCCYCGKIQFSELVVAEGHGPYAPEGAEQTLVWSEWRSPNYD